MNPLGVDGQEKTDADLRRIFGDPPPDYEITKRDGYEFVRVPRNMNRILDLCGMPPKFLGLTWDDLDMTEIQSYPDLATQIRGLYNWRSGQNLYTTILRSPPSKGKTALAAAKFYDVAERIGTRAIWVSWPDLITRIKDSWNNTTCEPMHEIIGGIKSREFVVIDDLAKGQTRRDDDTQAPGWLLEILYSLVNHFYQSQVPVLYTTELTHEQLRKRLDGAIADRINECGVWIDLSRLRNRRR